jgi:EmrB/QacA subfamily drug resistance transporter
MSENGDLSSIPTNASKSWTLVAMILASGIVFLDSTVVNVALPSIDKQLDAGLSGLQWIVDGYVLTLAALLILGGSLGDQYGRRRVMLVGLIGFGATSIACGLAPSVLWLIGARVLQGVTAALLVPGSLAIIRAVYTEREERGKAIGTWSGWSGITTVLGPLLGGWLVDNLSWRWVFFIKVPIVILTAWLIVNRVPESWGGDGSKRLDWAGATLATVGLGGIAYGLIEGPVSGWESPFVVIGLTAGLIALALFPMVEARLRQPMVPLSLFRSRNFTGANLTTLGVYFALYGMTFFLVIYLQNVLGYSALASGLVLAPISLLMLILSPRFGRLAGRYGPRFFMTIGPLVCSAGLLLLARLQPDSGFWTALLPAISIFGIGLASTVAPLTGTVVSSVPDRRSGVAAAFNNAVSRVAALVAIASLGAVVTIAFQAALEERITNLSLTPSSAAVLENMTQKPTGAVDAAQLPPEAEKAVSESYTVAFHWAMVLNATMAFAGGLIATATIRDPSSHRR